MGTYWSSAAPNLVLQSIYDRFATDLEDYEKTMEKYADYRDGRTSVVADSGKGYFTQRKMETDERFADRPKISIPLGRLIVDVHNEALTSGVRFELEDEKTAEAWEGVDQHNNMSAYYMKLGATLGTYGYTLVRPVLYDDGTKDKTLEFDSSTPLESRLVYESTGAGRSVPRYEAVITHTGYNIENGDLMPWPVRPENAGEFKHRVELVTKDRWIVWLDNSITPESPFGEIWMPDPEKGLNPLGRIPTALINGLETEESMLGISDLHTGVDDIQVVNEIWSDVVYMHRLYVPIGVFETDESMPEILKKGIGTIVKVPIGGSYGYANPGINFASVLEPMSVALELALANSKTPAMSVGLGHIFGSQARSVDTATGVAKAMEWKATVRHAKLKRGSFERGCHQLIRNTLHLMKAPRPYGQAKAVDPETKITTHWPDSIVPTSAAEELEMNARMVLAGMKSLYQAMIDQNGWDDDRAQRELDMIAVEKRNLYAEMGARNVIEAVMARHAGNVRLTPEQKERIFGKQEPLKSDMPENQENDDDKTTVETDDE